MPASWPGGWAAPSRSWRENRDVDGSGRIYGRLVRQPILIFSASGETLTRVLHRAMERNLRPSIYTRALFATGNDVANRAAVAALATEALDLVGFGLHAERKDVDKITKGLALHP